MGVTTTLDLHDRADAAAGQGDFAGALRFACEALRLVPLDGRARLKAGLCLMALGRPDAAVTAIRLVAETLTRRGYVLSAIGACRDALGIRPGAPEIRATLERIHDQIHGVEGRGRARVPPPSVPTPIPQDAPPVFLDMKDDGALLDAAIALATRDPDEGAQLEGERVAVPLFSDLSKPVFLSLVERMTYLKVPANSTILREGDPGASLFILVQGEVAVSRASGDGNASIARLGAGSLFGELALIRQKPRSATVTTAIPAELFQIGRELVEELVAAHPAISEELAQFARRRLLMNLMATSKIFAPFSDEQRLELLRSFMSRVFEPGTRIIEDGKEPSALYLLLEGEVEVSKVDPSGDKVVLAYLREGEVFGEIALVERRLTTATVTTTEKSVLLQLERARFEAFTQNHPKLLEYLSGLSGVRREETETAMSAEGVVLEADDLIIL